MPVAIEQHVDWIADCIEYMRDKGWTRIEAHETPRKPGSSTWPRSAKRRCTYEANSWYLGANIPGKPRVFMPYVGGQPTYRERCDAVRDAGYEGFVLGGTPRPRVTTVTQA